MNQRWGFGKVAELGWTVLQFKHELSFVLLSNILVIPNVECWWLFYPGFISVIANLPNGSSGLKLSDIC